MTVVRIWYGWTTPEDADVYEDLLKSEILDSFADMNIDGYRGVEVARRPADDDDEVEFVTTMRFDSWGGVESFAGENYEEAHVPESARAVLKRWDDRARHYEVRERVEY